MQGSNGDIHGEGCAVCGAPAVLCSLLPCEETEYTHFSQTVNDRRCLKEYLTAQKVEMLGGHTLDLLTH